MNPNLREVILHLKSNATLYRSIKNFSDQPGIYALFFVGNEFPLKQVQPSKDQIVYIGKTESSQISRDRNTHFASGKTGSSTLRRSFGAMLMKDLSLKPIPRSKSNSSTERTSHYKFDKPSEEKLTQWMQENLGLSFYPFPCGKKAIDNLETQLIDDLRPILNIDRKNPQNPYGSLIRSLRKITGLKAYNTSLDLNTDTIVTPTIFTSAKQVTNKDLSTYTIHKYEDIWTNILSDIILAVEEKTNKYICFNKATFDRAGNRKSYSFRVDLIDNKVSNNIKGSAVARDLARVVNNSSKFRLAAKNKHVVFKLSKDLVLSIEIS